MTAGDVSQPQKDFDYGQLSAADRRYVGERAERIYRAAKRADRGILMGQCLREVKVRLTHGQWLSWLKYEFSWTHRTAVRLMQISAGLNSDTVSDLNPDGPAQHFLPVPKHSKHKRYTPQ